MLKSEARSSARIEYLSKVAKQEPQYEPPPSTSRTRSTHTSGAAPSTRRSKTSRGGAPTYMKSKEKAGARWRSMLSEDELETVMTKDNINSGRQFSELLERLQEEPIREMARQEMLKARAEAAINPKPTHTPKPAHWRKKTFTCDVGASTEAHAIFEQLATSPLPLSPPPEAGPKFGSKREMSTKGREWQLEKQRQMQELRKLAELRSSYKESVAVCNFEHRNRQMEYMRTPAHELRTTATDRARAKEKSKRAKEEVERSRSRSMDSRYVVAQQEAEARAAEAAAAAAARMVASVQERAESERTPAVDDVMTGAADDDMPPTADDVLPPPAKAQAPAAADTVW